MVLKSQRSTVSSGRCLAASPPCRAGPWPGPPFWLIKWPPWPITWPFCWEVAAAWRAFSKKRLPFWRESGGGVPTMEWTEVRERYGIWVSTNTTLFSVVGYGCISTGPIWQSLGLLHKRRKTKREKREVANIICWYIRWNAYTSEKNLSS
jgi:hypothetical protein